MPGFCCFIHEATGDDSNGMPALAAYRERDTDTGDKARRASPETTGAYRRETQGKKGKRKQVCIMTRIIPAPPTAHHHQESAEEREPPYSLMPHTDSASQCYTTIVRTIMQSYLTRKI